MTAVRDGSKAVAGASLESKAKTEKVAGLIRTLLKAKRLSIPDAAQQMQLSTATLQNVLYKSEMTSRSLRLIKAWAQRL